MSRWRLLALSALTCALAALLTVAFWPERSPSKPAVETMDDPLWYRTIDSGRRLLAARIRLDTMTSNAIAAKDVGPIKDEIALLCGDEAVIDMIVASFHERKEVHVAQLSAYFEIFSRVRHPKFAPLVRRGISESGLEVKINALDAAITQRDPGLVEFLALEVPRSTAYQRLRILAALTAIGTEAARNEVRKLALHTDESLAIAAITTLGRSGIRQAVPDLIALMTRGSPNVRVMAAWAVAELGNSAGRDALRQIAGDVKSEDGVRAQALQNLVLLRDRESTEVFRAACAGGGPAAALEGRIGLAVSRADDVVASLQRDALSADHTERRQALTILGRTGLDEDVEWVRGHRGALDVDDLRIFAAALPFGRASNAVAFLESLARDDGPAAANGMRALCEFGEAGLESLGRLLDPDGGLDRFVDVVAGVGSFKNRRALELLETCIDVNDRKKWRFVREMVRLVEQETVKL